VLLGCCFDVAYSKIACIKETAPRALLPGLLGKQRDPLRPWLNALGRFGGEGMIFGEFGWESMGCGVADIF
jgi:hypothetical protein